MSGARAQILDAVRRALGRGPLDASRRAALEARIAEHRANPVPARGKVAGRARVEAFVNMAEHALASVDRVRAAAEVPEAVAAYLKRQNLPPSLRLAPDRRLDAIPWGAAPMLTVARGTPQPADEVGLTGVFRAVAETGTLILLSGPDSPTALNFLPETHIAVVEAGDIVGAYEEAWDALRARGALPRTVNMITGPSRSGDIEQTLQLGAHGPRRLHIVLVDPDA